MKRNYFDVSSYLITEYFSKEPKRASQAESTVRNTIQQVRNQQNKMVDLFEHLVIKEIPTISPAFRWAQSLNTTYLEVKWATRFDSPSCLDVFDLEFRIEEYQTVHISAMCRNDKKLLRYAMSLELQDCVDD